MFMKYSKIMLFTMFLLLLRENIHATNIPQPKPLLKKVKNNLQYMHEFFVDKHFKLIDKMDNHLSTNLILLTPLLVMFFSKNKFNGLITTIKNTLLLSATTFFFFNIGRTINHSRLFYWKLYGNKDYSLKRWLGFFSGISLSAALAYTTYKTTKVERLLSFILSSQNAQTVSFGFSTFFLGAMPYLKAYKAMYPNNEMYKSNFPMLYIKQN